MKCLLDSMLVLTKQDRLCHVIHSTSDPFYQTWLRQLNVMQHCKVCSDVSVTPQCTQTYSRLLLSAIARKQRHAHSTKNESFPGYLSSFVGAWNLSDCMKHLEVVLFIGKTTLRITVSFHFIICYERQLNYCLASPR